MLKTDFDFFNEEVILKFYKELKTIDEKFCNGKAITLNKKKILLVYHYYESFRKEIRKLYMSEEAKPMDRHKIASNMMFSILKAKVIKVNRLIPNLPLPLLLANEYLAFYCAVDIIEVYKRQNLKTENYSIVFPSTYIIEESKNSYLENTCKALYYTKSYRISDILAYANTLFLLEKQTDTILNLNKEQEN